MNLKEAFRFQNRLHQLMEEANNILSNAAGLSKKDDQVSAELNKHMVNTEVVYEAPFDVNDTFAEVLQADIDSNEE